jgi:hypothetical protein
VEPRDHLDFRCRMFSRCPGNCSGIIQFRWSPSSTTTTLSARVPYSGLMRWHYITGVIFGVFTLTWIFSGLLSMDPWEWVSGEDLRVSREPFSGGSVDLNQYPAFDAAAWAPLLGGPRRRRSTSRKSKEMLTMSSAWKILKDCWSQLIHYGSGKNGSVWTPSSND